MRLEWYTLKRMLGDLYALNRYWCWNMKGLNWHCRSLQHSIVAPWRDAFPLKGKYLIFHLSGATLVLRKVSPKMPTKLDKTRLIGLLLQALTTKITRNLGKTQPGLLGTVCWKTLKHTQSESDSQKRLKVIWVAFLLEISQQTYVALTVMSISSTGAKRCASSFDFQEHVVILTGQIPRVHLQIYQSHGRKTYSNTF